MRRWDYKNIAIEYDSEVNALYIYIKEGVGREDTRMPMPDLNVDIGPEGDVVGVEVLL